MIAIENLWKTFGGPGGVQAVRGLTLDVPPGCFYVLLGPSGCGKTTTLRCVAGLERPDNGAIRIADTVVCAAGRWVPPEERGVGMVFQSYAVWPHLNVWDNVAFPLRHGRLHLGRAGVDRRVEGVLALLRLDALARRPVTALSGGQQQRVALARALALEPRVLLMDEPLSNLDAKLREELRVELKLLARRLGITTLYVTHDQTEALMLGDQVAVLADGVIVQSGAPEALYQAPRHQFVASFLGNMNLLEGRLGTPADGLAVVETALGPLRAALAGADGTANGADPGDQAIGTKVLFGVRPEDVEVLPAAPAPADGESRGERETNRVRARVREAFYVGAARLYQIEVGGVVLQVQLAPDRVLTPSTEVSLRLPPARCRVLAV
jgi:ABC-type Fe3+/spermidine/putrescine transport system ATPase subunit